MSPSTLRVLPHLSLDLISLLDRQAHLHPPFSLPPPLPPPLPPFSIIAHEDRAIAYRNLILAMWCRCPGRTEFVKVFPPPSLPCSLRSPSLLPSLRSFPPLFLPPFCTSSRDRGRRPNYKTIHPPPGLLNWRSSFPCFPFCLPLSLPPSRLPYRGSTLKETSASTCCSPRASTSPMGGLAP